MAHGRPPVNAAWATVTNPSPDKAPGSKLRTKILMSATIAILLFEDFEALDVIGPLALFRAVPELRVLTVAAEQRPVTTGAGVSMFPDATCDTLRDVDVIMVPGGEGIVNALRSEVTLAWLRDIGSRARYVTSVCTGSLILGAAGLLRGYRATTHWRSLDLLPLVGAEAIQERIVRDRNRITGGGVTAGLDFGLALISALCGDGAARTAQLALEYDPLPPFDAGTPKTAPPEAVRSIVQRTLERQALRREILESMSLL
jgi:cyclohexyl-isocyanide hydratase